jgi:uncharacterized protein DUF6252
MKTFKKFGFTALAALAIALSSCSSDSDGGGGSSSLDTYISAKVDGANFETTSFQGQSLGVATKSGSGDSQAIIVSCSNATDVTSQNFEAIHIAIIGPVTVGNTYDVNSNTNTTLGYVMANPSNVSWDTGDCDGATGTITITALTDTKIEGTFTFTGAKDDDCASHKVVTEGEFRGTFQN